MAALKLKKKAKAGATKRSTAKTTSRKKPAVKARSARSATRSKAEEAEPVWLSLDLPAGFNGANELADQANRALAGESVKIVDTFTKQAKQGNATSAKFLFELATKMKAQGKSSSKALHEIIAQLENSPEYPTEKVGGSAAITKG